VGYGIPVLFLFLRGGRSVKPAITPIPAAAPAESADPAQSPRR
jgi:hypothetical protein